MERYGNSVKKKWLKNEDYNIKMDIIESVIKEMSEFK